MKIKEYIEYACKKSFSLTSWFKNLIVNYRLNKAIKKWNQDIPYIQKCIKEESTEEKNRNFYWRQLVWQEIKMYINIGEKIDIEEFVWLCNRRGFTLKEQNYLQNMMHYVGLWKTNKTINKSKEK